MLDTLIIDSLSKSAQHSIEALKEIAELTQSVAQNTEHSYVFGDFTLIATISTAATIITIVSLYFGFRQNRIDKMCQRKIFADIVRHFYRNKICISTMRAKYIVASQEGTKFCYPSEEHYLKLNVLPDDLHLEKYYQKGKTFDLLHKLHVLMRNFNVEAEVALAHIKEKETPYTTKLRDFATLDFKCGFLTQKICEVMAEIWGWDNEKTSEFVWENITKPHRSNIEDNASAPEPSQALQTTAMEYRKEERTRDWYFTKPKKSEFEVISPKNKDIFAEMLTKDIAIELSCNSKGDEKIHIVIV
ncbi:MAG: hypothetical protein R3Y61_02915 [Rikenellaceae bacterium]